MERSTVAKLRYGVGNGLLRREGAMRGAGGFTVFIALLLILKVGAMADDTLAKAQAALMALRADVESGRVVRADIFAMSYDVETPITVTPDLLPAYASHNSGRFSIELNEKLTDGLIRAIDSAQLRPHRWGADLRWGAVFLDRSGMQLHSVYLNSCYFGGAGREGYIDGIRVGLSSSLIVWFESNFSNGSPPCADGPSEFRNRK
jgi:hypothetical protein